ncbi:hypothetical protein L0U85_19035 [Glycomyces sp. L485]|uniref:hypothetical protein n=1 Tax=Glycomyces sp. L485 TaxID=2909235 RepID=UPI001F4A743D|nr:hypothetical protein [Glycomyces sp. L485]MCH7232930.1 hypothetical protein [Glycomyces sp. L485]
MSDRPEIRPEPDRPEEPVEAGPVAPLQIAPEPGAAPVLGEPEQPAEPEHPGPRMTEPESARSEPAETEEALALPPTTSVEPHQNSQPDRVPAHEGSPVPFAAPPTERNQSRFAAKLVISILGGVAIVGTVIVALVLSLMTLTQSYMEKIEDTAEAFMSDLSDEQWDDAYGRLCTDLQDRPVEDYLDDWQDWEADGAEVLGIRDEMSGTYVRVELDDGTTVELLIAVEQGETIDTTVCGWEHIG